jgi:hypothetical protein
VATVGVHVLVEWGARAVFGLAGVAIGLAVTTALVLLVLLASLGAVSVAVRGIALATVVLGVLAAAAFGLPRLVAGPLPAAAIGLVLYAGALALWRPPGLRHAWAYLRTLQ